MPGKSATYNLVSTRLKRHGVSEKKEPILHKFSKLIEAEKPDKAEITSLAIQYLSQNKGKIDHRIVREKFQAVFAILCENDIKTAEGFAEYLNGTDEVTTANRYYRINENLPAGKGVDVKEIMKDHLVKDPVPNSERVEPKMDVSKDARVVNLQNILADMKGTYNPIYHINRKDYRAMLKAMTALDDYRQAGNDNIDKKVLDKLLKNVADKAEAYVRAKDALPTTPLGQQRLKLALQAVYSVDPDRAEKLIGENTDRRIQRLNNMELMFSSKIETTRANFKGGIKLEEIKKDLYDVYSPEDAKNRLRNKLDSIQKDGPSRSNYGNYIAVKGLLKFVEKHNEAVPFNQLQLLQESLKIQNSPEFKRVWFEHSVWGAKDKILDVPTFADEVAKAAVDIKNEKKAAELEKKNAELEKNLNINNEINAENANVNQPQPQNVPGL